MDLSIYPIVDEEDKYNIKREIDERLPDVYRGQLICIVAPIRSGKSLLVQNLLLREEMYRDLFDEITIISPTVANDATSRFIYKMYIIDIKSKKKMDYDRLAFIERLIENEWERCARDDYDWNDKDDRDIMGEFAREWYEEVEKLERWLKEQFEKTIKKN